jgi:hypothetical protein
MEYLSELVFRTLIQDGWVIEEWNNLFITMRPSSKSKNSIMFPLDATYGDYLQRMNDCARNILYLEKREKSDQNETDS